MLSSTKIENGGFFPRWLPDGTRFLGFQEVIVKLVIEICNLADIFLCGCSFRKKVLVKTKIQNGGFFPRWLPVGRRFLGFVGNIVKMEIAVWNLANMFLWRYFFRKTCWSWLTFKMEDVSKMAAKWGLVFRFCWKAYIDKMVVEVWKLAHMFFECHVIKRKWKDEYEYEKNMKI